MPPGRVTRTISRRMAAESRTWRSTVTAKTRSKRSAAKRSRAPSPTACARPRPDPAPRAETARGARHDATRVHTHDLPARSHQARGITGDDARARADLEDALAATDVREAQEAATQARLGGRAATRLEMTDVPLGLALPVDGAVR